MATFLKESTFSGSGGSHFKARLEYSYTQDKVNNKTTITYILKMVSQDGWSGGGAANSVTGYIGGTSSSDKVGNASSIGTNSTITIGSRSYTITHNADGTFPSQSYSARIDCGWNGVNRADISGTLSGLPTIPRDFTTKPTLTYVSATETEMSFTWTTSEACSQAILYKDGIAIITQSSLNTTSGSFNATRLTAGTESVYYVKCTRKDSSRDMNSDSQNRATYAYPYVQSIGTPQITLPVPSASTVSQTITLYNPLNRTNVTVYAKKDSSSGTEFAHASNSAGTPGSVTLSLSTSTMYNSIPSATSGTVAYYCIYNDGSNHQSGNTTGTFITTASNCGPTVSANPTYTNKTSAHATLVGTDTIIQGQSAFRVTSPTVTFRGGASAKKYYFKIGNGVYENTGTTNYKDYTSIAESGSIIAYTYVEDSRGYTSTVKSVSMRVLPYAVPSATIDAHRTGYSTSGTITVSATRSTLSKSSATSTDVNNWRGNTSSNRVSLAISPTDATLAAATIGGAGSFTNQSVSISNLNLEKSYTITVNISDRISTVTKTIVIEKASPILSMNAVSSAVGINTMVGDDASSKLVINGNTTITNGILTADGSVSISPNAANTTTQIYNNTYLRDNANLEVSGQIKTTKTTDSSSTSTGALVSAGGLGVAKKLYVGSDANISGNASISGSATATKGFVSYDTGNVNTASGTGKLIIKKASASADSTPNDGIVLEFGNYANYTGQLWLGNNAAAGLAWNGWSNGTRGTWRALAFQDNVDQYSTSETKVGTWIDGKPIYRKVKHLTTKAGWQSFPKTDISSNIDRVVNIYGNVRQPGGTIINIPFYIDSSNSANTYYVPQSNYFVVTTGSSYGYGDTYIIVEYTKTT